MDTGRMLDVRGVFQVNAGHVRHAPPTGFAGLGVLRAFGFDVVEAEPVRRRKIPGGTVKIVFAMAGTVNGLSRGPAALVIGMHDRGGVATHSGRMCSAQLQLGPLAARRLLGVPLSEFRNGAVDLADLFGPQAQRFVERLAETPCWDERFALIADFLRARSAEADPDPVVAAAVARLRASRGRASITELATEIGWSRRHFARRFGDHIGLSPKSYASLARFSAALSRLTAAEAGGAPDLGELADQLGYYDQSHLTRDFQRYAGTSPARFHQAMSLSSNTSVVVPS
ncbi:AraC family transcriptional regulator [Nocardia sp. 2]|uniref:AraC family transcriptional regulator n=1 Tax=Nocardia acididurans TaxID=2802282 RepID=A0ABS1M1Y1_9NOCA|nr:helix-turn-helix domain-containing protein [Nocardia acididurans]MBL1073824.1 AraC family transcriptional regulator [Nocardia acididurans]